MLLFKKTLRDFWQLKAEFLSVLCLSFLSIFLFTGLLHAANGMQEEFDTWAKDSQLADLWVTYHQLSPQQAETIRHMNNVSDVQSQSLMTVTAGADQEQELQVVLPDNNSLSVPTSIKGEPFQLNKTGIWLDDYFAKANHYKVGDTITLWLNNQKSEQTVKGLILSANYVAYTGGNQLIANHQSYGYAYASENTFPKGTQDLDRTQQLLLKVKNKNELATVETAIENELDEAYLSSMTRENHPYIGSYVQKTRTLFKLSIAISLVSFLLTFLTSLTTMQRLVKNQQAIIGSFKALGFKNRTLLGHYGLYGLLVSTIGASLGLVIAPSVLTPRLLDLQKEQFMVLHWHGASSPAEGFLALLLIFMCTLVAILSVVHLTKRLPVYILRPPLTGKTSRSFLELFGTFWQKLSFEWKWVFRDISRNRKNTFIAVLGILGSMMLLVASLSMRYSFE